MSPAARERGNRILDFAMAVATFACALLAISYAWKLHQLEGRIAPPSASLLAAGTQLPAIEGTDEVGARVHIGYEGAEPTVIYVFTPTCPWCKRNMANLRAVMAARSGEYRFVGLSLVADGVSRYIAGNDLHFSQVVTNVPAAIVGAYKVRGTPDMFVVGPGGRLSEEIRGAWTGSAESAVERRFGLRLPGLLEAGP